MKKRKIKYLLLYIFMGICLLLAIYSSIKLFMWKNNVDKNNKINDEIKQNINTDENDNIKVDFDSLKKTNSDTIAVKIWQMISQSQLING